VTVVAVGAATIPAALADDGEAVLDPLADPSEAPPTSDEIASRIERVEPRVERLEIPEPRSLREEVEEDERTTVALSTDVLFAFDSAELGERARATLADLASALADVDGPIEVVGHTDSVGSDDYNRDLSERRAEAVAEVLRDELGADADLRVEGRGSSDPVATESDDDPEAAARNRRVEISHED
jgi:OmpA-OmpF porin, OOP family